MTSQNLSSLTPSLATRFKPYISHKKWVLEPLTGDFRKRCYKHIRSLSLKPDETLLKRMPMPKTLHSLNLDSWKSDQNLAHVKKFLKQYQKYLRNIHGSSNHPKIQKLLPHLADREVNVKEDSLRTLFFYSGFKRLHFNFERLKKDAGEAILRKYKTPLSRNLTTINGLETLSMNIAMQEAKPAILLLEMINQHLPLDSLKQCSLIFASGLGSTGPQKVPEQKANISKVLAKLTDLSLESTHWYCFLISSGKFTNLSVLNLKLFSKQISCDLKDVLSFHNLSTLKNFSLYFDAHSLSSERSFFEDFTLPSSIEALSLSLAGFTLSLIDDDNDALLSQFLNRLQEVKGVKVLNLKIAENPSNLSQTAKFACLLIKCFDRLGTLNYATPKQDSFLFKEGGAQSPPAEFQDFWAALGNSKETLYNISLHASEMILPQTMSGVLETGFSKLQKLELQGGILLGTELGRFCQKISSLTSLTLKEMRFQDEEKLKLFLDEMKEIPKGGRFELHLDVAKIKQECLIDCLKKYIEDAKVKGQLKIYFTKVQAGDKQAFDEISKLAMEKGCFEVFQMTMGHSNRLFSVEKNKIIQVTGGLFM